MAEFRYRDIPDSLFQSRFRTLIGAPQTDEQTSVNRLFACQYPQRSCQIVFVHLIRQMSSLSEAKNVVSCDSQGCFAAELQRQPSGKHRSEIVISPNP
jgi:hypothetical protein